MAEQGKIQADSLISSDVIKRVEELDKSLTNLIGTIEDMAKTAMQLDGALKNGATTQEELAKTTQKTKEENEKLTAVEKEILKIEAQKEKVIVQAVAARSEEAKELEKAKKLRTEIGQAIKEEIKLINSEADSIDRLANENKKLIQERNKLSTSTDEGRAKIAAINAQIDANNKVIKENTSALERQKNNVGAYAESLDGAIKNVGEIRKELVALRNMSLVGKTPEEIDALNKRIGQLTDQMNDLKAEQKALGTELGTALAGSLKLASASMEGFAAATKIVGLQSPALEGLQKNMIELIAVTQALGEIEDALGKKTLKTTYIKIKDSLATAYDSVVKGVNTAASLANQRAEAARAVMTGKASIATKTAAAVQWLWNAAIAANPVGALIVGVAALVAGIYLLTRAFSDEIDRAEILNEKLNILNETKKRSATVNEFYTKRAEMQGATEVEKIQAQIDANDELQDQLQDEIDLIQQLIFEGAATEDQIKRQKEARDEYFKAGFDALNLEKQLEIEKQNELERLQKEAEKEFRDNLNKRAEAIKKAQDDELKGLALSQEQRNLLERVKYADGIITENQYQQNILAIDIEFLEKRMMLAQTEQVERLKMQQEILNKQKQIYDLQLTKEKELDDKKKEQLQKEFEAIDVATQKRINALNEQYIIDLRSTVMTAEQKEEISRRLAEKLLQIEIERIQKELALRNLTDVQKLDLQTKLTELLVQQQDTVTENKLANDQKEIDSEKEKAEVRKEMISQATELANGIFELGSALRERELSEIEAEKEKRLELAGDDAKQKERIEKEYQAKSAQVKRRQAVADKVQALFNAAINTAVQVTKVLANPILAAIVAAAGAVQIAAIAAKPIPKFARGVTNFEGGLAEVGEAGRELIELPTGKTFLTPDKATKMLLPKGANVYTHNETEDMLRAGVSAEKFDQLIKEQKETRKALSNKIENHTTLTQGGLDFYTKKSGSKIKMIDKYLR